MVRVVVAGHVNWDVTLRVDALPDPDGEARVLAQRSSGGGSAANVAVALVGLGVDAGVVGSVGDDENGILARRELARAGVDLDQLRVVADAETSVKYLVVAAGGEVMVLGNDGANEAVEPGDVDRDYVSAAAHLHLTSQRPDTAAALAEAAADAGLTVSFDPGRRLDDRDFSAALDAADVVFVNRREAASLFDDGPAAGAGDGRVIVETHGARGAAVHAPDGTHEHPGFGVESVDTTGAGDAFAAGFLATLLGRGAGAGPVDLATADYGSALEFANACGALAARATGARTAPTGPQVEAFLRERTPSG